jgi:hypothetical protein
MQSRTPAGVKFQADNLSIDDEDFKDNLYVTYEAVARNLINLTFANMQGVDLMKLSDEEVERLQNAGLEFPVDMEGNPTNELEIIWDEARATFDFEVDAEDTKAKDEEKRLEGLLKVLELNSVDPMLAQKLQMSGWRLDEGELLASIVNLTTDNDKIITKIAPEELEAMQAEQAMLPTGEMPPEAPQAPMQGEQGGEITPEQAAINVEAVMQEYGIDQETAAEMLDAEFRGVPPEQIQEALLMAQGEQNAV